jgi:hypothetical protein
MALDLLLQCQPILKLIQERAQAVGVCPVSQEFEQTHDECIETNPEIQIVREQNVDELHLSNVSEDSVGETIKATESCVCDAVTNEGMIRTSKSDTVCPTEIEIALKEHVVNPGCDNKEGYSKETQHKSGSNLPQETEEELAEQAEENSLVRLVEQRLQYVLRSLTKLCLSKTGNTKKDKE